MEGADKIATIEAVCGCSVKYFTSDFEEIIVALADGVSFSQKEKIITGLYTAPKTRLSLDFAKDISNFVRNVVKVPLSARPVAIVALGCLPVESRTVAFFEKLKRITDFVNTREKVSLIKTLCEVPADRLTAEFEEKLHQITDAHKGKLKGHLIESLVQYPIDRLTPVFSEALISLMRENAFTEGYASVVKSLINAPQERLTPAFLDQIKRFSANNMNYYSGFTDVLLRYPEKRLTPAFEALVRSVSARTGVDAHYILERSMQLPNEFLAALSTDLTEQQIQDMGRFLRSFHRRALFDRLIILPTSQERVAEINRTIALYRHAGGGLNRVVTAGVDIHVFSAAPVVDHVTQKTQKLNDAVIEKLKKALSLEAVVPYDIAIADVLKKTEATYDLAVHAIDADVQISEAAKKIVTGNALKKKNWETEALKAGGNDLRAQHAFSLVYTLLSKDLEQLELWLSSYLDESLNARGKDTRSCVAGMRERVITSLRSVVSALADKGGFYQEIDSLFKQVEGGVLATKFLQTLNLSDQKNYESVVDILTKKGITRQSSIDGVLRIFEIYVRESLVDYGLKDEVVETYVETAVDQMESLFDSNIKTLLASEPPATVVGVSASSSSSHASSKKRPREELGELAAASSSSSSSSFDWSSSSAMGPAAYSPLTREEIREKRLKAMSKAQGV